MLCIIFTKKKLLAGVKEGQAELLKLKDQTHIPLSSQPLHQILNENLSAICNAYTSKVNHGGGPISVAVAFPIGTSQENKKKVRDILNQYQDGKLQLNHEANLIVSFLYGIEKKENLSRENYAVLEGMDDYVHLCYHVREEKEEKKDVKIHGSEAVFEEETFEFYPFRDFGRASGNEKVLNELLTEFSNAGLSVDVRGQTDLAIQLMNPNRNQVYTISKQTNSVSLEAEVQLGKEKYNDLFTFNRGKIKEALSKDTINKKNISKIWLMGDFMKNDFLKSYLEKEIESEVIPVKTSSFEEEISLIISGLSARTQAVLEADRIRAEEEERKRIEAERRAKISAELKVKQDRETLLEEIRTLCVDPGQKEKYEAQFVSRGEALGIPDLVIKWNINEALTKVQLELQKKEMEEGKPLEAVKTDSADSSEEKATNQQQSEEKKSGQVSENHSLSTPVKDLNKEEEKQEKKEEKEKKDADSSPVKPIDGSDNKEKQEKPINEPSFKETLKSEPLRNSPITSPQTDSSSVPDMVAVATLEEKKDKVEPKEVKEELKGQSVNHNGNGVSSKHKNGQVNGKSEGSFSIEIPAKVEKKENEVKEKTEAEKKGTPKAEKDIKVEKPEKDDAKEEKKEVQKDTKKHKEELLPSLNDLFSVKGALADPEFTTKKVALREDQELKVIRILASKDMEDQEKVAKFEKLYKKELSYYTEMSEITPARKGKFYYRNYIERSTLKDYVSKIGLDKKLEVESLTSNDLKFILQVFKEVRELEVAHANLTEDTILVIAKRKWNLQKNVEIKFVGFTSEDCTNDEMIEQTHTVFSKLLGKEFYKDFRQKFDL